MAKLQARMILEILGRPPEHLAETLGMIVERMKAEQGVSIIEKKIHEPKPVKDSENLFTTFAEVAIETDSLLTLFGVAFGYMPANIEIIKPETMELSNSDLNTMINRLLLRLHDYDAITKKTITDREILIRKLAEVAPHLFKKEALPAIREQETLKDLQAKSAEPEKSKEKKSKPKKPKSKESEA